MKCYCLLDGLVASALRFVSLALTYSLLGPGFIGPSPQDLEVLLLRCPSGDRNFISRSTMVQMRIKSLHASPDGAKLMKPKIDLVSRFLVNANGQSPVPVIKKRKQWRSSRCGAD